MSRFCHRIVVLLAICALMPLAALAAAKSSAPTITLSVDATEAPRHMFHAQLTIPASGNALTLYYPKWMPGEHGPTGPIQDLTGSKFVANGQTLKWRRDLLDGWTFHVELPPGTSQVEASLDFASPVGNDAAYTAGVTATDKMAVVSWNTVLLYPAGWSSNDLTYQASLRLPEGWKFGTALPVASQSGNEIKFNTASLTSLVDSPVITGEYLRVVPLAENPTQEMDIASDSEAALDAPPDVWQDYRNLTDQAYKLFGARHFRDYHFLLSLSDHVAHFGLEHHESNDSRTFERSLVDPEMRLLSAGLLPHEYVHSWNGKYRRPYDLYTPDYEKPMQDDLLWVYEGLTSYLGDVLSARSGLRTPDQYRDGLASIAAGMDHVPGRTWRNLQDTADGVPAMQGAPRAWTSWRRTLDYYPEDVLNWLWVDTIIRQQSKDQKSIDDFCHLFHGGPGGQPEVKTYTFDQLMEALNQVQPYDWHDFWTERLTNHGPGAPLTGIEDSGWKLVYDGNPSPLEKDQERERKVVNAAFSIGLWIREDGNIVDIVQGLPAANAGIAPGMKLVAVNGRRFTPHVLHDALKMGMSTGQPLALLVENADYFQTFNLNYHGGEKYPHLVRDESKPDLLSEIIKAK